MPSTQKVTLRDTTLREGIQIPGSRVGIEQKRLFVKMLRQLGMCEVEIGLPDGMEACAELAAFIHDMVGIQASALVPCYVGHWRRQVDGAVEAGLARIDILAPVSDHLLKEYDHYGMAVGDITGRLGEVIEYAGGRPLRLGVGLIDACRAPLERILEIIRPLGSWGADRLVIYDSVGTMLPSKMTSLVKEVRRAGGLPVLAHCHNDYGLATANTLAAVEGGAEAVDVAVNGLGGRAGNAALEEVALALENLMGLSTGLNTAMLKDLSAFVEEMTGLRNSPLKPIVGDYCFAHVPVMHVRCIAGGNPAAFEPFAPGQIGAERRFGFSLAVDYRTALEPFVHRSGCSIAASDVPELVQVLRSRDTGRGLSEPEVIQSIREFHAGRGDHAGAAAGA